MALFGRKKADEPVDPNDRSPKTGLKYKDLAVLGQLMNAGADLTQPRHVLHFLYFDSHDVTETAAREARRRDFDCEVREPLPQYPGRWSLVAERHGIVLDPATVRDHGDFFDALAAGHQGEYDGWEASV